MYRVIQRLPKVARERNHNYIGTEHLLLSLAREEDSMAAGVLGAMGAGSSNIEESLVRLVDMGEQPPVGEPLVAPRMVQVLGLAQEEQESRRQPYIGTENLLLGILREGNGMAVAILRDLGLDPAEVQERLLEQMNAE